MNVDQDVDGKLAQQLGCLGTSDREALIRQFQQVLGPDHQVTPESCAFFLDMNNWNVQAALGSYYDYGSSQGGLVGGLGLPPEYTTGLPAMEFVQDVTIGEGESVPPATRFRKTWRVRNPGPQAWPDICWLRHVQGTLLGCPSEIRVPCVPLPGECADVSVDMVSPAETGIYESRWQLSTQNGVPFGDLIWCIIMVDAGGLMGITQQMASAFAGSSDSSVPRTEPNNPFQMQTTQSATTTTDVALNVPSIDQSPPQKTLTGSASANHLLNCSLLVNQGSPASSLATSQEFDVPESPNGSSALCQAVTQSVISWQAAQNGADQSALSVCASSQSAHAVSPPQSIINVSFANTSANSQSQTMNESSTFGQPLAPPGTPCTPPNFGNNSNASPAAGPGANAALGQLRYNLDTNLLQPNYLSFEGYEKDTADHNMQ